MVQASASTMPRKRMANDTSAACGPRAAPRAPSIIVAAAAQLALGLFRQQHLRAAQHDLRARWNILHDIVVVGDRLVGADRMPPEELGTGAQIHPGAALPLHDRGVLDEYAVERLARRDVGGGVHPRQQPAV